MEVILVAGVPARTSYNKAAIMAVCGGGGGAGNSGKGGNGGGVGLAGGQW